MSPDVNINSILPAASSTTAPGDARRPVEAQRAPSPRGEAKPASNAIDREALSEAVSRLNTAVQTVRRELQFRIDDNSGRTVITVINRDTDEVIRQIPPEEILSISNHLREAEGLLVRGEA